MRYSYLIFNVFYLYASDNHHIPERQGCPKEWPGLWHIKSYYAWITLVALLHDKVNGAQVFLNSVTLSASY